MWKPQPKSNTAAVIAAIVALLTVGGCRTTTHTIHRPAETAPTEAVAFFEAINRRSIAYNTLTAQLQLRIVRPDGRELASRARLKIRRDHHLQLSIQPLLGVELFRIDLTTDSITALDRINKCYVAEPIATIARRLPVPTNYATLQALFTNRLFLPERSELPPTADRFRRQPATPDGYTLHLIDTADYRLRFTADRFGTLRTTTVEVPPGYALDWHYANFTDVADGRFPAAMHARLATAGRPLVELFIELSRITPDSPATPPTAIPPSYRRITLNELLQSIEQIQP